MSNWRPTLKRLQASGSFWLLLSAALFLLGAVSFEANGLHNAATIGVGAAIAAIVMVIAFR